MPHTQDWMANAAYLYILFLDVRPSPGSTCGAIPAIGMTGAALARSGVHH